MSLYGAPVGSVNNQPQQSFVAPSNWEDSSNRQSNSHHSVHHNMPNSSHHGLAGESERQVVKVRMRSDIRRLPLNNEDLNYDEFIIMMQRIFKGKLSSSDEIVVKYKDEDGDLITIVDDADLSFAMRNQKVLKVELLVNGDNGSQNLTRRASNDTSLGASSDLLTAVNELQSKLAALPASLEQAFQRVLEKVGKSQGQTVSAAGDTAGQKDKQDKAKSILENRSDQQSHNMPVVNKSGSTFGALAASVENGFDEGSGSRTGSVDQHSGLSLHQHRLDADDLENNLGQREASQPKDITHSGSHQHLPQQPQPNLQNQFSQQHQQLPQQQQQQQHQFPPQHQQQQQHLPQQHQQHTHQHQPQQQQTQAQLNQQFQQGQPGQPGFMHSQFQPQNQSQQQMQQGMAPQLKAQYSFPPPAGNQPPPQQQPPQMQQNFSARGPTPSHLPPSVTPTPTVGPPPMGAAAGQQMPPGMNPYARPPGPSVPPNQPGAQQFSQSMFGQPAPGGYPGGFPPQANAYGMPPK